MGWSFDTPTVPCPHTGQRSRGSNGLGEPFGGLFSVHHWFTIVATVATVATVLLRCWTQLGYRLVEYFRHQSNRDKAPAPSNVLTDGDLCRNLISYLVAPDQT